MIGKPVFTHTIIGNSYEELDILSNKCLDKMRGKIEILEMKDGEEKDYPQTFVITYYYRDTIQVEFTLEELEYIAEVFNDRLKDSPENTVIQSIVEKTVKAAGWE